VKRVPFTRQQDSGFSAGAGYHALREYTQEKAVAVRLLAR
jgi:aldehyde dehydrogenase (NAD+)